MSDFLGNAITHAGIQDNLLQSYRSLSLSLQSIFLGIGVFLLTRIVESTTLFSSLLFAVPFIAILVFAIYANRKFTGVILCRGQDVNFWHKQLIAIEQDCEVKNRFFTRFKVSQKHARDGSPYLSEIVEPREAPLTEAEIKQLVGEGLGHTRKVIDKYIPLSILVVWGVVSFIVVISIYTKVNN
ncbi:MAG: hypothetical protein H7A05_00345 [Pseudomonadales bacterium]|nr:hypothetical protein [Pseudomonadales bacterium]